MSGQWAYMLGALMGMGNVALGYGLGRKNAPLRVAVPLLVAYALLCGLACLGVSAHG